MECDAPEWTAAVSRLPDVPATDESAPAGAMALRPLEERSCLLAGAPLTVAPSAVTRLVHRLLGASGTGLRSKLGPDSALALLAAAVEQDDDAIAGLAVELDVASQRVAAIAPFIAMPLLQACHRRWARDVPSDWAPGHCPVCAAWPALAEVRGPESSRHLRCSRCGAAWGTVASRCAFCECAYPDRLATLAVGVGTGAREVEVCQECGGYLKVVASARAIRPADVAMRDLLTLDLDLAALDAGYSRPTSRASRPEVDAAPERPRGLLAPLSSA